jgi:broad specificity phosphatase PhoE
LTAQGWQQMRHASGLGDSHEPTDRTPAWSHIISSPLDRCRAFALSTAATVNLDARIEERWQEIDYGDWDGMPIAQWRKLAADQFVRFRQDLSALAPPNGEDYLSFKERITAAWESLACLPDGSHALVVTHGGVLRVVLPLVLGMPLNRSFPLHIPFACYSRVELAVQREGADEKTSASLIFHNGAAHRAG